jgi:hypothetical protein
MSITLGHPITYRGWEIDRYRQPDGCHYAYAPSYDGLTEWHTQCAPTLRELCDNIDDAIEEHPYAGSKPLVETPQSDSIGKADESRITSKIQHPDPLKER